MGKEKGREIRGGGGGGEWFRGACVISRDVGRGDLLFVAHGSGRPRVVCIYCAR